MSLCTCNRFTLKMNYCFQLTVDGVHGDLNHVVRHVVVDYRIIPEYVTIPNHHVEGKNVKVLTFIPTNRNVMIFAVQVR